MLRNLFNAERITPAVSTWAGLLLITVLALGAGWGLASMSRAATTAPPTLLQEVEMEHAWCYVLVNDTLIKHVDMLSCVPKK